MLKILLIIVVISVTIRILTTNYIKNDIKTALAYKYNKFTPICWVNIISGILNYIIGVWIIILFILKLF